MSPSIGRYVRAENLKPGDAVVNGRNIRVVVSKEIGSLEVQGREEEVNVMCWMGRRHEEDFELEFWSTQCRPHALFLRLEND